MTHTPTTTDAEARLLRFAALETPRPEPTPAPEVSPDAKKAEVRANFNAFRDRTDAARTQMLAINQRLEPLKTVSDTVVARLGEVEDAVKALEADLDARDAAFESQIKTGVNAIVGLIGRMQQLHRTEAERQANPLDMKQISAGMLRGSEVLHSYRIGRRFTVPAGTPVSFRADGRGSNDFGGTTGTTGVVMPSDFTGQYEYFVTRYEAPPGGRDTYIIGSDIPFTLSIGEDSQVQSERIDGSALGFQRTPDATPGLDRASADALITAAERATESPAAKGERDRDVAESRVQALITELAEKAGARVEIGGESFTMISLLLRLTSDRKQRDLEKNVNPPLYARRLADNVAWLNKAEAALQALKGQPGAPEAAAPPELQLGTERVPSGTRVSITVTPPGESVAVRIPGRRDSIVIEDGTNIRDGEVTIVRRGGLIEFTPRVVGPNVFFVGNADKSWTIQVEAAAPPAAPQPRTAGPDTTPDVAPERDPAAALDEAQDTSYRSRDELGNETDKGAAATPALVRTFATNYFEALNAERTVLNNVAEGSPLYERAQVRLTEVDAEIERVTPLMTAGPRNMPERAPESAPTFPEKLRPGEPVTVRLEAGATVYNRPGDDAAALAVGQSVTRDGITLPRTAEGVTLLAAADADPNATLEFSIDGDIKRVGVVDVADAVREADEKMKKGLAEVTRRAAALLDQVKAYAETPDDLTGVLNDRFEAELRELSAFGIDKVEWPDGTVQETKDLSIRQALAVSPVLLGNRTHRASLAWNTHTGRPYLEATELPPPAATPGQPPENRTDPLPIAPAPRPAPAPTASGQPPENPTEEITPANAEKLGSAARAALQKVHPDKAAMDVEWALASKPLKGCPPDVLENYLRGLGLDGGQTFETELQDPATVVTFRYNPEYNSIDYSTRYK